jgi:hypothetical protein
VHYPPNYPPSVHYPPNYPPSVHYPLIQLCLHDPPSGSAPVHLARSAAPQQQAAAASFVLLIPLTRQQAEGSSDADKNAPDEADHRLRAL